MFGFYLENQIVAMMVFLFFKKIYQSNKELAKILTKKPLVPQEDELKENSRSRSAKLRVITKAKEGENFEKKKKKYQKSTE